jgi:hypothetical protein
VICILGGGRKTHGMSAIRLDKPASSFSLAHVTKERVLRLPAALALDQTPSLCIRQLSLSSASTHFLLVFLVESKSGGNVFLWAAEA